MFYASLSGSKINYSCGTLKGPFSQKKTAENYCAFKNRFYKMGQIPPEWANWALEVWDN